MRESLSLDWRRRETIGLCRALNTGWSGVAAAATRVTRGSLERKKRRWLARAPPTPRRCSSAEARRAGHGGGRAPGRSADVIRRLTRLQSITYLPTATNQITASATDDRCVVGRDVLDSCMVMCRLVSAFIARRCLRCIC